MRYLTIDEVFCGTDVSFPSNCEDKVCKFRNILDRFYGSLIGSNLTRESTFFSTGGEITITTTGSDIYRVEGIYVVPADGCSIDRCWILQKNCDFCADPVYMVAGRESTGQLQNNDYSFEGDTMTLKIDDNIDYGWVSYSRGGNAPTSVGDKIHLREQEIPGIQLLAQQAEAENRGDFELANYFENRFFRWQKNMEEKATPIPHRISGFRSLGK